MFDYSSVSQPDAEDNYKIGKSFEEKSNFEKAREYYEIAASQKHPAAQYSLGFLYNCGYGVEADKERAAKLFELAANQGHLDAQFKLGLLYESGDGVKRDDKKAAKWFELAANQGYSIAQFKLGLVYIYGLCVKQDDKKAAKWFELAANQGIKEAQKHLGKLYLEGKGVEQSYKEAKKWFEVAGDRESQYYLGHLYLEGKGVEQSYEEAAKLFRLAAKQGDYPEAQYSLGKLYLHGQGVEKNLTTAAKLFQLAARKNQKLISDKQVAELFQLAAINGEKEAQYHFGCLYWEGIGVVQSNELAFKWFKSSAENEYPAAQYSVGLLYSNGEGVSRNMKNSIRYLKLAADNHDKSAIEKLNRRFLGNALVEFAKESKWDDVKWLLENFTDIDSYSVETASYYAKKSGNVEIQKLITKAEKKHAIANKKKAMPPKLKLKSNNSEGSEDLPKSSNSELIFKANLTQDVVNEKVNINNRKKLVFSAEEEKGNIASLQPVVEKKFPVAPSPPPFPVHLLAKRDSFWKNKNNLEPSKPVEDKKPPVAPRFEDSLNKLKRTSGTTASSEKQPDTNVNKVGKSNTEINITRSRYGR